ncbi:MAG: T9SS type A sorting domain-containing protein, partial [Saprospiraceae bacterium]
RFWDGVYFMSKDTGVIVGRSNTEGRAYVTYTGGQTWNPGYVLPFPLFGVTGIPHPNGTAWIYGFGSDIEKLSFCNAFPVITDFAGDLTPCEDDTLLYTIQSENIDAFIWNFPNTWSVLGNPDNDSIYVITGSAPGGISVIGLNDCGFSEQINVQSGLINLPDVHNLTGDPLPCVGDVTVYGILSSGVDLFNWIFPTDWQLISTPNSDSIFLMAGLEPGIIGVNGVNTCGASNTLQMNVDPFDAPDVNVVVNGDLLSLSAPAQTYQWYLDGEIISGAVNQTYLATENGLYHAQLNYSPSGCTTVSDTVNFIVSSLTTDPVTTVKVFPVPVSDLLHVIGVTGEFQYSIVDVFGKVITQVISTTGTIQVDHLVDGIYFLDIKQDNSRMISRFIKQ